jgi:hypothetical protein
VTGDDRPYNEFEDNFIRLKHPDYGTIRFVPLHCNDNQGATVASLLGEGRQA